MLTGSGLKQTGLIAVFGFWIVVNAWAEDMEGHHHPGATQWDDPLLEYVEGNCSENEAYNQKCFSISKAECSALLPDLYERCDQEPSSALFDPAREESAKAFAECLETELLKHLEVKGIDFDPKCE